MNDNTLGYSAIADGRWCIVRTSPGRTLGLMASLNDAGIDAWTPSQTVIFKRPRSTMTFEREVAIAPTFVFVRAHHLRDLAVAEASPVSPHPSFTLFRHGGRIPLVADSEVDGFRQEEALHRERRAQEQERLRIKERRKKRQRLVMGQRVSFGADSAFAGMSGKVEKGGDRFVLVNAGSPFRMRIATWLLSPDEIEQTQPDLGAAA